MGPSYAEDAVHAAYGCGIEHFRADCAVLAARGAELNQPASRNLGGDGKHQNGGEEGSGASRDIQAYPFNRYRLLYAAHARRGLDVHSRAFLGAVKGADVLQGAANRLLDFGLDLFLRAEDFLTADFNLPEGAPVDFERELAQGIVAAGFHPLKYLDDGFAHGRVAARRAA